MNPQTEPNRLRAIAAALRNCTDLTDDQGAIETLLQASRDLEDRADYMERPPTLPLKH